MTTTLELIDERLDRAFARYQMTATAAEVREEIRGNLQAAATDQLASGADEATAVATAWADFGDLEELLAQLDLAPADQASAVPTPPLPETPVRPEAPVPPKAPVAPAAVSDPLADVVASLPGARQTGHLHAGVSGITRIVLDYACDEVRLQPTLASELSVTEQLSSADPAYAGTLTQVGTTLQVTHGKRPRNLLRLNFNGRRFGFWSLITVNVPVAFTGSLQVTSDDKITAVQLSDLSLELTTTDGHVTMSGLDLPRLSVHTGDGHNTLRDSRAGAISLRTDDGNLTLSQLAGTTLAATTADGHLDADTLTLTGDAQLSTGDGRITLSDLTATSLNLRTADGRVQLARIHSLKLTVKTGDGRITGTDLTGGHFTTADGHVDLQFSALDQPVTATTGDGNVSLALPPDAAYAFALRTFDGRITQPEAGATFTKHKGKHRVGQFGTAPQATITVQTGDGSIILQ